MTPNTPLKDRYLGNQGWTQEYEEVFTQPQLQRSVETDRRKAFHGKDIQTTTTTTQPIQNTTTTQTIQNTTTTTTIQNTTNTQTIQNTSTPTPTTTTTTTTTNNHQTLSKASGYPTQMEETFYCPRSMKFSMSAPSPMDPEETETCSLNSQFTAPSYDIDDLTTRSETAILSIPAW